MAFQALVTALEEPLAVMAANGGFEPRTIVAQVRADHYWEGFDARNGQIVNMWRAGIVDPVPVLMKALEVAPR